MGQSELAPSAPDAQHGFRVRRLVVAARSARYLALAAARAGFRVHAVDAFSDADTVAASAATTRVDGIDHWPIEPVLKGLLCWRGVPLIYGAGFESQVDVLDRLRECQPIIGNPPDVLARVTEPGPWFAALRELKIDHPETRFSPPDGAELAGSAWLIKRAHSSGGLHIAYAQGRAPAPDDYWQRRVAGASHGVCFLTDGVQVQIVLGVRHVHLQKAADWPFRMSGAVTSPWPLVVQQALLRIIEGLVDHFALRGMNGLDFLITREGRLCVLEINARPPSTLALLAGTDWIHGHIAACAGRPWGPPRGPFWGGLPGGRQAALAVLYCPHEQALCQPLHSVSWLHDMPPRSRRVVYGEPCFSVSASAASGPEALRLLKRRSREALRACLRPLSV